MRDPYQVLNIARSASADEIKKAYRKLAKKHHPDQNPSDPKAQGKFAEVNQAYEILGDEKKKLQFDRGEIDAEGKPKNFGFGFDPHQARRSTSRGGGEGFETFEFNFGDRGGAKEGFEGFDFFADLFGGGRASSRSSRSSAKKGADISASLTISLEDALRGVSARVTLPTGRALEVKIPAGIEDGTNVRLKGQGHPSSQKGEEAGDALISVHVAKHPFFRLEGRDLRLDLPVTLYEAVLGAHVPIPTLTGQVEMAIPPYVQAGRVFRLRGKGAPAHGGHPAGDLLVTVRITLPESPDPALDSLMRQWQDNRPWTPRKNLKF